MDDAAPKQTVTIKKYANRRLYNTATSSYVTLDHLSTMVKQGVEFNVYDAKSGEDITRSVLTQIIVEEEGKAGQNLLPIGFLRQLIGFYGNNMQWLVPKYLDHSMQSLSKNQEQIRTYFQSTFGSIFPFGSTLEEMGKQNLAMFERAMRLFSPFGAVSETAKSDETNDVSTTTSPPPPPPPSSRPSAAPSPLPFSTVQSTSSPSPTSNSPPLPRNVMPLTASDEPSFDQDVQKKISALQRQLAEIAKSKG